MVKNKEADFGAERSEDGGRESTIVNRHSLTKCKEVRESLICNRHSLIVIGHWSLVAGY